VSKRSSTRLFFIGRPVSRTPPRCDDDRDS
jgi:hypothetical protein